MRPVSSVYGRISEVLLAYPGALPVKEDQVKLMFGPIVESLDPRVRIYLLGKFPSDGDPELVAEWLTGQPSGFLSSREVIPLTADLHTERGTPDFHRDWVQDPFIMIENGEHPYMLEPYSFGYSQDRHVAEQVASKINCFIKPTRYYLEGGNFLCGDDFGIIGPDIVERNRLEFFSQMGEEEGRSKTLRALRDILGVRWLVSPFLERPLGLGKQWHGGTSGFQALYHLDLFITLGGKDEMGRELIYVADLDMESHPESDKLPKDAFALDAMLRQTADFFAGHASDSAGPKFEVRRLPMLPWEHAPGKWAYVGWSNCLVEATPFHKRVWLPQFDSSKVSLPSLDALQGIAKERFTREGFHVIQVPFESERAAKRLGGLNCLVKVMKRNIY